MRTKEVQQFILSSFGRGEFYGYEVHKALELHGESIGVSRLYRILDEMKQSGLLKDRWEKSTSGPQKRIYVLTRKGITERNKLLFEAIDVVHDFYLEYLLSLPPKEDVFKKTSRLMSNGLGKNGVAACIARKPSVQLKQILSDLRSKISNGNTFLIHPFYSEREFSIEDWQNLDGSQGNIPLKDDYLDLLLVVDLPPKEEADHCFNEWRRAIKPNGKLAIIIPTILITDYPNPLLIGMFMEKMEHGENIDEKRMNVDSIRVNLGNYFGKIEEHNIVHMTLFIVSEPIYSS
ncbi:MAG: PadR family transcriptional regulator [Candidatus Thorarchaeota archaeon]